MSEVRKLNTVLFADISGYSSLMQKDEKDALSLLRDFKEILEATIPTFEGVLVQYFGDGCLLTFDSTTKSVKCSIVLQKAFVEKKIPVRIGLHLGEVLYRNNNVFGDGVNIASRIESLGVPGSILLSKSVHDQIRNKSEFQLANKGSFEFKNVEEAMMVYAVANEGIVVPKRSEMVGKTKKIKSNKLVVAAAGIVGLILLLTYLNFSNNKVGTSEIDKSIAVLPFVDMSPTQDQAYLGDGVAEEILNILSRIKKLRVIARTSSFQFRGDNVDVRDIGEKLRVGYILEGSIRKIEDRVRITTQLINSKDGSHLWSENFDQQFDDIFQLQEKVAESITKQLQIEIGMDVLPVARTFNPEAYENYLKGLHIHRNLTFDQSDSKEKFALSERYFLNAIEIDSTFAEAHAGLSDLYDSGSRWLFPSDSIYTELAEKEATIAVALNPESSYALRAKSLVYLDSNEDLFFELILKAIQSDPNDVENYKELSYFLERKGLHEDALAINRIGCRIDPTDFELSRQLVFLLLHMGRFEESVQVIRQVQILDEHWLFDVLLYFAACYQRDTITAQIQYKKMINSIDVPDFLKNDKRLDAIRRSESGLHVDINNEPMIGLVMDTLVEEWDSFIEGWITGMNNVFPICCPTNRRPMIDMDIEYDPEQEEMLKTLQRHPRFPELYQKYQECIERSRKKFNLNNTPIRELLQL